MAKWLTILLGAGFTFTGIFIFFYSREFFSLLGSYYGTFNNHFVKDAGIAFFSSGVMFLLALKYVKWRFPLTLCGALFIVLHGLFHVQMMISGMIPSAFIINEIVLNVIPPLLALYLLFLRLREPAA